MDIEGPQPFPDNKQPIDFDVERKLFTFRSGRNVIGNQEALQQAKTYTECRDCVWSPDGKMFAWSCGERRVKIMSADAVKHNHLRTDGCLVVDCRHVVTSLSFININQCTERPSYSPGYQLLRWEEHSTALAVGLKSGRIRILNVMDGSILLELIDHKDHVSSLSVARNRNLTLVSSSHDGTIKFWDLADDGNMSTSFVVGDYTNCRRVRHKVTSVVWSPDATRVAAAGTFKAVVIFDMVNRCMSGTLTGHVNHVNSCEFSPDGVLLLTCSVDTTALLWNSHTGQIICKLGHQFPEPCPWFPGENDTDVLGCKFSKSGLQVATIADDGYLRFWDLRDPHSPISICPIDNPLCCSFSQEGNLVAVGAATGDLVIIQHYPSPAPLSHLCRLASNNAPHIHFNTVDKLRIPLSLKGYLKYENMEL